MRKSTLFEIPAAAPISPYRTPKKIEVPDGKLGFIGGANDPPERHIQERWVVKVQTFNLSDDKQAQAYADVWQAHVDGLATITAHREEFSQTSGAFFGYLRWAHHEYKLPEAAQAGAGEAVDAKSASTDSKDVAEARTTDPGKPVG